MNDVTHQPLLKTTEWPCFVRQSAVFKVFICQETYWFPEISVSTNNAVLDLVFNTERNIL